MGLPTYNQTVGYAFPVTVPVIAPRARHPGGRGRPRVEPDLDPPAAAELAAVAKALGDPTRLRIVDAVRKAAPDALCQCELLPLFEMSQPALAKHLRTLVDAGILATERRGLWAYYFLAEEHSVERLRAWLAS
ncbi:MAG: winged helix-turn-helix transcriptional regulator [Actinobacteria bacterium]|nr:MAG: winged helix-turn-helix transcriptional regulator [Actinomycetota bacterium]